MKLTPIMLNNKVLEKALLTQCPPDSRKKAERDCKTYNSLAEDKPNEYNCPICKNKRNIMIIKQLDDDEFDTVLTNCECVPRVNSDKMLKASGLADYVISHTFDNFNAREEWQKQLLAKAKAFPNQDEAKCFFIGGNSGAGKTHICTATTYEFYKANKEIYYLEWREGLRKIRASSYDEKNEALMRKLKTVDVLFIDDLFKTIRTKGENYQKPTKDEASIAWEIIAKRLDNGRFTIISTECTLDEIMEIDEAIGSRIKRASQSFGISIARDTCKNYRLFGFKK